VTRTYVIADVHGRFDLLVSAMEAISIDAREHRKGSIPEHKIVLLADTEAGAQAEEIIEYLTIERSRCAAAPIILNGGPEYTAGTDFNPDRVVISVFNDADIAGGPIDFIEVAARG
jgi:hypothetical protein